MFRVGQKVVCVDASLETAKRFFLPGQAYKKHLDGLAEGRIYTVRAVGPDVLDGKPCLRLEEIVREKDPYDGFELGYAAIRFRPVVERKTDISVFTRMLDEVDERYSHKETAQ